jgi:hypothetical protein
VRDIVVHGGGVRRDAAHGGTRRPVPGLAKPSLDGHLDGVVELDPAPGQELDPVVRHRVVAGRQHHAEVGTEGVGQERHAGRGQHTQQPHVDSCRREPGDHGGLEELAGDAGVPADHGEGTVPLEDAALGQHVCCRDRQVQGQLRRQRLVGETPDPVGTEKTCHEGQISAC